MIIDQRFLMAFWKLPRKDMRDVRLCSSAINEFVRSSWEESFFASGGIKRLAYALWLQLWHSDADDEWGLLLKESRRTGYDGEIFPVVRP